MEHLHKFSYHKRQIETIFIYEAKNETRISFFISKFGYIIQF